MSAAGFLLQMRPGRVEAAPSILLAVSPTSTSIQQNGATVDLTVTLTRNNFVEDVALNVTGLPTNVTASYPGGQSFTSGETSRTIRLTAASNAQLVTGQVATITATAAGVTNATAQFSLTVTASIPQSISLSISPASANVTQNNTVDYTVTLTRLGGYTDTVALSASGLPTGVQDSYPAGNTLPNGVNSRVLRLSAASDAPTVSNDSFSVTGTGPGVANAVANGTVTVTSSDALAYTNQPAGMTPFFEFNGDETPVFGTYSYNWFKPGSAFGVNAAATNPPRSPNNVLRLVFDPPGITGDGGGDLFFTLPTNTRRVYFCQWVRWSSNWRWHPGGAKMFFWRSPDGTARIHSYWPTGNIDTGPAEHRFDTSQQPTNLLRRGVWHKIEVVAVINTDGASNGSYRVWNDGVLVLDNQNTQFWSSNTTFRTIELVSTQGGGSVSYPAQQVLDTDHIYISTSTTRS